MPGTGVIGVRDPGWMISAQARMVLEWFIGNAGVQNVLLTVAHFFLGRGGSTRKANLGAASISRTTNDTGS